MLDLVLVRHGESEGNVAYRLSRGGDNSLYQGEAIDVPCVLCVCVCVLRGGMIEAWVLMALLRSEEHTSELQSLMRISYAVFCLKKKITSHRYHMQASEG